MTDLSYIKPIILYDLYFTKDISNITIPTKENLPETQTIPQTPPAPKSKKRLMEDMLSPEGKKIYKSASTPDKSRLLADLLADTRTVEEIEMKEYENDSDYLEKLENNGLGLYMESFISNYGICPICKQKTLRKYSASNMPVVDLICVNKAYHTTNNSCFLFQVKTSLSDIYFNKKENYITVGSKKFGYNSHIVKGNSSDVNKTLVIGYICLFLDQNMMDNNKYKINKSKSFVLVPDLQKKLDEYYYEYIMEFMGKNRIKWNNNLVSTNDINVCLNNIVDIDTTQIFNEEVISNPYMNLPLDKFLAEWTAYVKKKGIKIGGTKRYKLVYGY